jgi:glycosyltransferase involved in cell wall biosynthesis
MKISYAITAWNEHRELDKLLQFLIEHKRDQDEIVVQTDSGKTTEEVYDVLESYESKAQYDDYHHYSFPLNNNFAQYKNKLNSSCSGDWIFQIDADELPNEYLIQALPFILEANPGTEAYWVPRVNTVAGITDAHIQKWGWRVDDRGWVNFPDWQMRIYRNKPEIYWMKPVHEQLKGYTKFVNLPPEEKFTLYHPKNIGRQETQNKFYESL